MNLPSSWRLFARMQMSTLAVAVLIYGAAVLYAWQALPGAAALKLQRTLLWPGVFLAASFLAAYLVPPLRAALLRHLWTSYRVGFGQSVVSVLSGVGLLIALAGLIFWQVHNVAHGGRYPAGVFSGYGAGIGLLTAQALLVRKFETDPVLRRRIEKGL